MLEDAEPSVGESICLDRPDAALGLRSVFGSNVNGLDLVLAVGGWVAVDGLRLCCGPVSGCVSNADR
jgi:hypothetical protein